MVMLGVGSVGGLLCSQKGVCPSLVPKTAKTVKTGERLYALTRVEVCGLDPEITRQGSHGSPAALCSEQVGQ